MQKEIKKREEENTFDWSEQTALYANEMENQIHCRDFNKHNTSL